MKSLDRHVELNFEELRNGWFLISYDKNGVSGTKQVASREEIRDELIDIYHFLNCSASPNMYDLKRTNAVRDNYDLF